MADVTDSERYGKRVKHTRESHYVGGLFRPIKVGESYTVEPLPEEMRDQPEEAARGGSHHEMLADIKKYTGLTRSYLRVTDTELYKKGLCPYCERKLTGDVCETFSKRISYQTAEKCEPCCPECGEWLDAFDRVRVASGGPTFSEEQLSTDMLDECPDFEETLKHRAQPCGCLVDQRYKVWFADVPETRTEEWRDRRRQLVQETGHND